MIKNVRFVYIRSISLEDEVYEKTLPQRRPKWKASYWSLIMYIRQVKPDEHRLMSSSTFTLRFLLCPNISSLYILLNLFVNTSGLKRCLFKGMRTFQDLCIETPSQANQVSKHRLKCDVFEDFVLQQTNMITLKNCAKCSE